MISSDLQSLVDLALVNKDEDESELERMLIDKKDEIDKRIKRS